jgi:hypothetical protein
MPNRLRGLNLIDYTGGLNLRQDSIELLENECAELLNMAPQARGGVRARKGWEKWNDDPIVDEANWNPRSAYLHVTADDTEVIMLASAHALYDGRNGVFTQVTDVPYLDAKPHHADFISWNDYIRIACGRDRDGVRYNPINRNVVQCAASGGTDGTTNWQNNYTTPVTTQNQPRAEIISQHSGYCFVAHTREGTTYFPNRIRWSHFNNPDNWAYNDYWDITEGGEKITALVPFADRLMIFKPDSVWALYGYNKDTWEVANVSRSAGCVSPQAMARSESLAWFVSWPHGVFTCDPESTIRPVSEQVLSIFTDNQIPARSLDKIWVGWVNRRLWVSIPYIPDGGAVGTTGKATSVFVFDPEVGQNGAWAQFRSANKMAPVAYMERASPNLDVPMLAFSQSKPRAMILDKREDCTDFLDPAVGAQGFQTVIRTRWVDAGAPTHRKSWRRPDFLLYGTIQDTAIGVEVFHNFDHVNPKRRYIVEYSPATQTALWSEFTWGDGTLYGQGSQTTSVERGSTMGRAGAIQVRATGTPKFPWGFNGIVFKFIPRRFR